VSLIFWKLDTTFSTPVGIKRNNFILWIKAMLCFALRSLDTKGVVRDFWEIREDTRDTGSVTRSTVTRGTR
jgi:hypothetical protein